MRYFLLYITIYSFIIVSLFSNENKSKIYWNNLEANITITIINKIQYIEINELSKIFGGKYSSRDYTISREKEHFKFSINSFYIVYEINDSLRVAQMTMPAIWHNNTLLIPYDALLIALKGINLIDYNDSKGKLNIKTRFFRDKSKINKSQTIKNDHLIENNYIYKDSAITNDTIIEESTFILKIKSDSIKNPNRYLIPKKIKR